MDLVYNLWKIYEVYMFYLTIRALLAPRDALLFNTIFAQGQKVKYTNLQELEEGAR